MSSRASLLSLAASWVAPHHCLLCGRQIDPIDGPDLPLCPGCAASLRPIEEPRCRVCGRPLISEYEVCFACRAMTTACETVRALFSYKGRAGELIRAYKEGGRRSLAAFWAGMIARQMEVSWLGRILVPVPPRPEKIAQGLRDQVEGILSILEARGFAVARPLVRLPSLQQKRLSRSDRAENARKAYALRKGTALPTPGLVVLLDDVCTTGATIEACAQALIAGGTKRVAAIVLAVD